MKEVWRDIKGYEGLYQVSNMGNVKSLEKYIVNKNQKLQFYNEHILKPNIAMGYLKVTLSKGNKQHTLRVHILVAQTFIPNPNNKCEVNHKDGNKLNNCVNNLEWCSRSENEKHAYRLGLAKPSLKQKSAVAKYATEHYSKSIMQYDMNGNFIKEWESMADIYRKCGINQSLICKCCKHQRKSTHNYIWRYK